MQGIILFLFHNLDLARGSDLGTALAAFTHDPNVAVRCGVCNDPDLGTTEETTVDLGAGGESVDSRVSHCLFPC